MKDIRYALIHVDRKVPLVGDFLVTRINAVPHPGGEVLLGDRLNHVAQVLSGKLPYLLLNAWQRPHNLATVVQLGVLVQVLEVKALK